MRFGIGHFPNRIMLGNKVKRSGEIKAMLLCNGTECVLLKCAISGYFSGNLGRKENVSTVESWLNDADGGFGKAFKQLREGGLLPGFKDSLPDVDNDFRYFLDVAQKKGLKLFVYEGGQHIVGIEGVENNEKLTKFFMELNRRPEMYDIYTQLLNSWKQAGGSLFM